MAAKGPSSLLFQVVFLLLGVGCFVPAEAVTPLTRAVNWRRPQVLTESFLERNTKPIVYVIHKSWCPACEFMREQFADTVATKEFVRLSKEFVMIEALDDDEPEDPKFSPDGGYYPRVVLMDPSGKVHKEYLPNKDTTSQFKYTFYFPPQMVEVMNEIKADVDSGSLSGSSKFGAYNPGYSGDGTY